MTQSGEGLNHLRIPYESIKFGKKLEGQGYGSVFEGELDDRRVALKQLNITNLGNVKPKLLAEILTISRFRQHPNLVALLGFCDEKSNEIILVYEYVSSGHLADKMRKRLTTIQRLEICLDAARGLDYLHTGVDATTPGIVHGNIKLSKILLNSDSNSSKFEAKVSSFGLSKILPGQAQRTLESTDTADEAAAKVTKESDVYSFGVMLLEVLCGVPELVDTDDYQERHVTELVPKRLEQNNLRKIVHLDIRKEIKTESLETYAKIACQCVMNNPAERPTMVQVVKELEKALRLQGGEVSYVGILDAADGTVVEDGKGAMVVSNILEEEKEKITSVEEDSDKKLDAAGEDNGDEMSIVGTSATGERNTPEDITMQERRFDAPILNDASVPDQTHIQDASKESSTNHPHTTQESINDSNSKEKSKITQENEVDNQSRITATSSESSNGDTAVHSVNQDSQNFQNLESGSRNCENLPLEEVEDEVGHLRIAFDKIKFGKKIDVHGYGSMLEGEFDHRQVALKRLNITNLAHIKPKLLAEIVTVARFRQHPNVVALLGFCDEKSNEIILVYEYVSGGNLADKMSKHLTTLQRLEICLGAARGLDYLHTGVDSTPGIIHGDIKLSKILLNSYSNPLKFEAKVSGFGLSKLLPGQAQKTSHHLMDKAYQVTGKGTKESDVYAFGVLLLEVLCGVPELVDTDDYQERHVTELVPKRLEQNILRKIVHFDIRDEIRTESLETHAKIACQCVTKNPEQRPTMAQVVKELEIALRLQGREVSDIQIVGNSNGNGLPEGSIDEKGDNNGERMGLNIAEKESEVEETIDDPILNNRLDLAEENNGDEEDKSIGTNGEKNAADVNTMSSPDEDGDRVAPGDPESTEDLKLKEAAKTNSENEADEESRITTTHSESNIAVQGQRYDGDSAAEGPNLANPKREKGETLMISENKEEIMGTEISMSSGILDSGSIREEGDKGKTSESKRSDSSCSESSNVNDYLLQKTPANILHPVTYQKSRNCCSCAWWRFFSDSVHMFQSCFVRRAILE